MKAGTSMLGFVLLAGSMLCACGGGGSSSGSTGSNPTPPPPTPAATPTISTAAAQGGAFIVSIADTTSGATIYYTLDGSAPTTSSQVYQAPFLISSSMTVNAIAAASGDANSAVATQNISANVASGTLVWSDEFNQATTASVAPNSSVWTYDTGFQCCGNNEQETYCAPSSNVSPCSSSNPNAYVGTDGYLHIVAMKADSTTFTSARLKSQGLFSVMYGRIEARMQLPESQGMWPAFWMLGNNIKTINWPACGELDIMEHIDGSNPPAYAGGTPLGYDWIAGSVHGGTSGSAELNGTQQYHPSGFSAAAWHTYGMIWKKGEVDYYVDDYTKPYAVFKSTDTTWANNSWPFDQGPQFLLLNLAVGGSWPGNVDSTTQFPGNMLVDYVRIYAN